MKAAVVPAMHSKWEIREVPRPEPGPNQVLIKILASGICYTDVHQTGGALPGTFPRILGHEPAGEIVAIGLGVTTRKVGDRVGVAWVGIGGLGHLAVQYAKAEGFETIAVSRSADKDTLIRQLGADEIVRDGQGLTRAGGADVILGTSNSTDAMADTIQGLRPDGRLVVMGFEAKPLQVSPGDLIARRIRILGSTQNGPEYLHEALEIAAKGKVNVIAET